MNELRSSLQGYKQSHSYRFQINSGESGGPSFLDSVWDPQLSEAEFLAENYTLDSVEGIQMGSLLQCTAEFKLKLQFLLL